MASFPVQHKLVLASRFCWYRCLVAASNGLASQQHEEPQTKPGIQWETHRFINETRPEIDVRIELARYEVVIFRRSLMQCNSNIDQGIPPYSLEYLLSTTSPTANKYLVCDLSNNFTSGIGFSIHTMSEPEEKSLLGFDVFQELRNVLYFPDFLQHSNDSFICTSVKRAI